MKSMRRTSYRSVEKVFISCFCTTWQLPDINSKSFLVLKIFKIYCHFNICRQEDEFCTNFALSFLQSILSSVTTTPITWRSCRQNVLYEYFAFHLSAQESCRVPLSTPEEYTTWSLVASVLPNKSHEKKIHEKKSRKRKNNQYNPRMLPCRIWEFMRKTLHLLWGFSEGNV